MAIERHGKPSPFLRQGPDKPHQNKIEWRAKKTESQLDDVFDLHFASTQTFGSPYTEAFAFFYHGLLRKYVELLGIRFRPYVTISNPIS
jgi:hypothetical protein